MKRKEKHNSDFRAFARYTSLNVMSMIGLSCYILADTYFIANGIGADGLTALNLAIPIYSFINGIGLMLGVGGATRYAVFRAQGKEEEGTKIFMNMIYGAGIFAALFMAAGLFGAGRLAEILGADFKTYEMTAVYLKVILLFSPAFILNNIINCFVRNDGNPGLSMLAMLSGSFANIFMDYIFIFPMNLGIFGAVLATGFAPLVGLLILSWHFVKKRNGFFFKKIRPEAGKLLPCISIGMPALVTEVSAGLVMILYNILILGIAGNVGVAAYGIIANIVLVILSIYNGIGQGMQPVISDAYGKGRRESTGKILKYGMMTMLVLSVLVYFLLFIRADAVAMLFNRDKDPVLQQIAIKGIRIYFAAIPFAGFNILLSSYFSSMEKALPAQVLSWLRGIIFVVPSVFIMAYLWELEGVWFSFLAIEMLTAGIGLRFLLKKNRMKETKQGEEKNVF